MKDVPTWPTLDKLTVGGDFSENRFLLQLMADMCGLKITRPQTTYPSCMGAMLAAGLAMDLLHLEQSVVSFTPPIEIFYPAMCSISM